ncbi:MAG: lysophospholipid acyltransferase family protein [Proteobacteria bacterium]|nr:lysophospholipid acyltransferase family protein [Desulfobulbaceae bacterium]MBU4152674.1 lysophospholipid acyltransferase family protein [Pseudomonadota bacterium]
MTKRPARKDLRDRLFTIALHLLIELLRHLPRMSAIALMRGIGRLIFTLGKEGRTLTIRHLTIAFANEKSPREIRTLAGRVYRHFATALADTIRLPVNLRQGINTLITAQGIHHLDQALASGKGVLIITGHFGNWELLGAWLAQNGYPLRVVGTTLENEGLNKIVVNMRNASGYTNIARGAGTREIIRSLHQGCAIGLLIDQDTSVPGVFVQFFGKPAHTPTGPAILARKLGIPIIPIFMHLKDDLTYHIECEPPLKLISTDDAKHDLLVNTQLCSDTYEQVIRRFPEQWVWMHKRWKTRPDAPESTTQQKAEPSNFP